MSNTKLDPATLTVEELALLDHFALRECFHANTASVAEKCYESGYDLILARRALFGTAPEKAAKVEDDAHTRAHGRHCTCEMVRLKPKLAAPVGDGYQPIDRGEIKSPPQGGTGTVRPAAPEYRFCRNGCGAQVTFENGVTGPCSDCDNPAAQVKP